MRTGIIKNVPIQGTAGNFHFESIQSYKHSLHLLEENCIFVLIKQMIEL